MSETKFTIAGPRWRVWSSKNLLPSWTGEWKVSVLNGVGDVISEDVFSYVTAQNVQSNIELGHTLETQNTSNKNIDKKETEKYYSNEYLNP